MSDKVKTIVNFRKAVLQNTEEMVFIVINAVENPVIDFEERNIDVDTLQIWTGPGATGTQLTLNTDYTLTKANTNASTILTKNIFNGISIINVTYQSVSLYVPASTLDMYGDVLDETDANRLQSQIDSILVGSQKLDVSEETSFAYDVGNTGGLQKWALNNAISQANYSVHFANIGHKYNDQHVAKGDADLSGSSTLFYPTPVPDKTYSTGWVSTSDWLNKKFTANHKLGLPQDKIDIKFMYSVLGSASDSIEFMQATYTTGGVLGWQKEYIDNETIQIQTGANGVASLTSSGGNENIDFEVAHYKIEVTPKDNIVSGGDRFWYTKVESITPSGETVSALRYNTGFIQAISGFENKILGTTYGGDLDISSLSGIVGLKDVIVKLEISTDGTEANSFESHVSYESASASQQNYGTKLKFIDANTLRLSTGLHGLLTLVDGTGVTDVIDSETYYYRVTVIKANAVATYADTTFRQVITINDAVDVTITLPDATTIITERTYKRRGTGTGKVLFETVLSQKIDLLDPDQFELRGDVEVTFMPYAGNYEQKQVIKDWVDIFNDPSYALTTLVLDANDGLYNVEILGGSVDYLGAKIVINETEQPTVTTFKGVWDPGFNASYIKSSSMWQSNLASYYIKKIQKWQDRVKLAGL